MSDDNGNGADLEDLNPLDNMLYGATGAQRPSDEPMKKGLREKREKLNKQIYEDPTIDEASRQRLLQLMKDDSNLHHVESVELAAARAGDGIYGINRKNAEIVRQMSEKPGRRQTILTQGAKELSGTESSGILTGLPK